MNFAGKAYLKKRKDNLQVIEEQKLEESLSQANFTEMIRGSQERDERVTSVVSEVRRPVMRRQRSFERLSNTSLDRSLSSNSNNSDEEQELDLNLSYEQFLKNKEETKETKEEYHLKVDTNVVSISLGSLKNDGIFATGEPVICTSCQAALNCYSRILNVDKEQQI